MLEHTEIPSNTDNSQEERSNKRHLPIGGGFFRRIFSFSFTKLWSIMSDIFKKTFSFSFTKLWPITHNKVTTSYDARIDRSKIKKKFSASCLDPLKEGGVLNKDYYKKIVKQDPALLNNILYTLEARHILNKKCCGLVLNHSNPNDTAYALDVLNVYGMLQPEYAEIRNKILEYEKPYPLAKSIVCLKEANILKEKSYERILKPTSDPYRISSILSHLSSNHALNDHTFKLVFQNNEKSMLLISNLLSLTTHPSGVRMFDLEEKTLISILKMPFDNLNEAYEAVDKERNEEMLDQKSFKKIIINFLTPDENTKRSTSDSTRPQGTSEKIKQDETKNANPCRFFTATCGPEKNSLNHAKFISDTGTI